jgi:hypothetical protein
VPFFTTNSMLHIVAQPLRLQHRPAEFLNPCAEGRLSDGWVFTGADSTNALPPPYIAWARGAFVSLSTPDPMRYSAAQPLRLNHFPSTFFDLGAKCRRRRGGVSLGADSAESLATADTVRPGPALVPLAAPNPVWPMTA